VPTATRKPLISDDLRRMKRTPQAKIIRRALALTREEFAVRYHISLDTLRDWEQGRAEPGQPTQAYLKIIARDPERVEPLLNPRPQLTPNSCLMRHRRFVMGPLRKAANLGAGASRDTRRTRQPEIKAGPVATFRDGIAASLPPIRGSPLIRKERE
jgi:putative transcriptional regulator